MSIHMNHNVLRYPLFYSFFTQPDMLFSSQRVAPSAPERKIYSKRNRFDLNWLKPRTAELGLVTELAMYVSTDLTLQSCVLEKLNTDRIVDD